MENKTQHFKDENLKKNIEPDQNFISFYKKGVEALNAYKKNIEPHQNFIGFYKKDIETLNELQNSQNKGKNVN